MTTLPTINFIGCGRVGMSLAHILYVAKCATIGGVLNTSLISGEKAVHQIGAGFACESLADLPVADLTFITTQDHFIQPICEQLAAQKYFKKNAMVVHCNGALPATVLASAKACGAMIASFHPIKSFTGLVTSLAEVYCSVEGDAYAMSVLQTLFTELGAIVVKISSAQKALYHAACVIANNYSVTLHAQATECFIQAGASEALAKKIVSTLMADALQHLTHLSHSAALTGPLQRGDFATVDCHLKALADNPLCQQIYLLLAKATLPLTEHEGLPIRS